MVKAATSKPTTTVNIGAMIDGLVKLRDKKRDAQKVVDQLDEQYKEAELQLLNALEAQGLDKASGKLATASKRVAQVCDVEDWDKFYAYIHRHKYFHLLQKRVSDPAWRELMELNKKVPGTAAFTKVTLGLTAL